MKISIIYSSKTGNTAMLAEAIKACFSHQDVVFCGEPNSDAVEGDCVFLGFWTDKGDCNEDMARYMKGLKHKSVFLFGTAGFGTDGNYFNLILNKAKSYLDQTNTVVGTYMCQGKMPISVRKRYEAMQETEPEKAKMLIENFDNALPHPDQTDLDGLRAAVKAVFN